MVVFNHFYKANICTNKHNLLMISNLNKSKNESTVQKRTVYLTKLSDFRMIYSMYTTLISTIHLVLYPEVGSETPFRSTNRNYITINEGLQRFNYDNAIIFAM